MSEDDPKPAEEWLYEPQPFLGGRTRAKILDEYITEAVRRIALARQRAGRRNKVLGGTALGLSLILSGFAASDRIIALYYSLFGG